MDTIDEMGVDLVPKSRSRRAYRASNNDTEGPPPKRRRIKYDRERARNAVMVDYMGPNPIFPDHQFERTFRITKSHVEDIVSILAKYDTYWTETYDAIGRASISPYVKFLCAQKKLCYGVSFSAFQDYFQMGESSAREAVSKLTRGIVNCPEINEVYLRPMSRADARRVVAMHKEQHGVDGLLGSLDVMKVHWGNCPAAWKGQFLGKEGVPTIGLEVLADYNLWFWHDAFGFPGALNDISVWEKSPLLESMLDGSFSELDFDFSINGEVFNNLFMLVDGIYPSLARFLSTISIPLTKMDSNFAGWQVS